MVWSNYAFQLGVNKWGYIGVDPCVARNGDGETAMLHYTTAEYTGAPGNFSKSATGVIGGTPVGIYNYVDFDTSSGKDLNTTLQARVVCAGFRFRYTGMEMYRGGQVAFVVSHDQRNLIGESISDTFTKAYRRYPVTREWQYAAFGPMHTDDWEFVPTHEGMISPAPPVICPWSGRTTPGMLAALVFQAASSDGATFEVEYIQHMEYAGARTFYSASPSHVGRPEVVNTILSAVQSAAYMPNAAETFAQQVVRNVTNSELPPAVTRGITSAMIDAIGGSIARDPIPGLSSLRLGPLA